MKGDEKMTAADREREQLQLQRAETEAANKALKADNERKEKEREEMHKAHEEKMMQFREQTKMEFEARMDALNRQMENERQEVRVLSNTGLTIKSGQPPLDLDFGCYTILPRQ